MNKHNPIRLIQLFIISNIVFWTVSSLLFYPIDVLNNQLEQIGDGRSYVIAGKWLYQENFWASAVRPFFYPLLIGLPQIFGFEINRLFTFSLNYVFWISTIFTLYFFIQTLIKEKTAFVLSLFFASCFGLYSLAFMSTPENCFTLILLMHVIFLFHFLKNLKKESLFISTWLLGLSLVVRPTITLLIPLITISILYFILIKKINYKTGLVSLLLLISMPSIQILNMKRCYGNYAISYISHEVWYLFSGSYAYNKPTISNFNVQYYSEAWHDTYKKRIAFYQKYTKEPLEWHQFVSKAENDFKEQLTNNKTSLVLTLFRDLISNSLGGTPEIKEAINIKNYSPFQIYQKLFYTISQCQNILNSFFLVLFCPFIFIFHRKKSNKLLQYQLVTMLYTWFIGFSIIILSSFSFTQGDRFHVVTVPLSLIVFSFFFSIFTSLRNVKEPKNDYEND